MPEMEFKTRIVRVYDAAGSVLGYSLVNNYDQIERLRLEVDKRPSLALEINPFTPINELIEFMADAIEHDKLEIQEDDGMFYIFDDVSELFWPGDYDKGNHTAQERIIARMEDDGCTRIVGYCDYLTPAGRVAFDSESGCFECHANMCEPVEYVLNIINQIKTEMDALREKLQ